MNTHVARLLILSLVALAGASAQDRADEKEWIQLFNGKNLDGWDIKIAGHELNDNFGNTFRVEDGVLKTAYDQYEEFDSQFGHIFYKQPFSHYLLAVEYRFVGEVTRGAPDFALRNSGVMVHSQSAASMLTQQDFPISIEVQFLGGLGTDTRSTANLCTPGTHVEFDGALSTRHCRDSTSKTYHGEQWVRVETEVLGNKSIRHIVEGETVMAYSGPQIGGGSVTNFDPAVKQDGKRLSEGFIALQSEGHPVEFRKVELLPLIGCMDAKASNYKSYYVEADNAQCQYEK